MTTTIQGIDALSYGINRLRFPAPVPVGTKLRLGARLAEVVYRYYA